jgi:hypothetical protein
MHMCIPAHSALPLAASRFYDRHGAFTRALVFESMVLCPHYLIKAWHIALVCFVHNVGIDSATAQLIEFASVALFSLSILHRDVAAELKHFARLCRSSIGLIFITLCLSRCCRTV